MGCRCNKKAKLKKLRERQKLKMKELKRLEKRRASKV